MRTISRRYIISKNLSNIPGWRTKRKLVVIESDDWGSIRMPSKVVYSNILNLGIDLIADEGFRYNKYDSIATDEDLYSLFDVLSSVKDKNGASAVLTPFTIVANPDFDKIQQSEFKEYFYEPFNITHKGYYGCESAFKVWTEGIENKLFLPQFHGREHLNVREWMKALRDGHKRTRFAFDNRMWGISTKNDPKINVEFQAAFDFIDNSDITFHGEIINSGLDLFENLFGYRATCFVPPNGPLSSRLEKNCFEYGLRFLSTSKIQREPLGNGKSIRKLHWLGQKNNDGLTYLLRNCVFEPGEAGKDWVDSCLNDISIAFKWNKPAVIGSHRVNFIGALYPENRDDGLRQLGELLRQIIKKWPDAEFVTTAELGQIIEND